MKKVLLNPLSLQLSPLFMSVERGIEMREIVNAECEMSEFFFNIMNCHRYPYFSPLLPCVQHPGGTRRH